ncbi:methyl-CpG binding domain protein, partial [Trifolium pratense]
CLIFSSPSGQQFVSCKEVSSYLQSRFGHSDLQLQISHRSESILQEQRVTTENSAGVAHEEQDQRQIVATNSDVSGLSVSNERLKEMSLLEMENLADVQIHDLFECHKCNMTFGEKDAYLEHLLSIHQKTTRRYRLGSSVSDGVIIKDGKFECQFCHKVFLEKRRYNSHVGIHVRNYLRKAEDLPGQPNVSRAEESPVTDEMPSKISKMDALIEIAQNSIVEDSVMEPSSSKLNTIHVSEIAAGDLDEDINVESLVSEQQMEESLIGPNVVHDLNRQVSPRLPMGGTIEKIDNDNRVINAKISSFLDNTSLLSVNNKNVDAPDTSKGKGGAALTVDGFDHSGIDLQGISQIPLLPSFGNHMTPGYEKSENSGCTNTKGDLKLDENNSNKSDLKIGLDGCKDVPGVANVQVTAM